MKSYIQAQSLYFEGECPLSANCCLTAHKGSDYIKCFWSKICFRHVHPDFYSNVQCRLHIVTLMLIMLLLHKSNDMFLDPLPTPQHSTT